MIKKITNYSVIGMVNVLDSVAEKKLPQKIAYAITRNLTVLSNEYKLYTDSLEKLYNSYKEYFVNDDSGNPIMNDNGIPIVEADKQNEFNEEIANLLNIEVEVNLFTVESDVFDYDDGNGRYDTLSVVEIMNLQSILCDENDNPEKDRKE